MYIPSLPKPKLNKREMTILNSRTKPCAMFRTPRLQLGTLSYDGSHDFDITVFVGFN